MHESPIPNPPSDEEDLPEFDPVPLTRHRHDGWTPQRQRDFIAALAVTGVVSQAARAVGMSHTSAYNLRRRRGARSFAIARDMVQDEARERALAFVTDHVINGVTRARFYRGKFVGTIHTVENRMAMTALRAAFATPPLPRRWEDSK